MSRKQKSTLSKKIAVILILLLSINLIACKKQTEATVESVTGQEEQEMNVNEEIENLADTGKTVEDVNIGDNAGEDANDSAGTEGNVAEESGNQVPEESEEIAEEPDTSISLIMVGDVLLHDRLEERAKTEEGTYDYSSLFEHTADKIKEADLALVNQEVIIGGAELGVSGYPNFNAPFEIGDELVKSGFDVICHGTNHALDRGKNGILSCLEFWRANYPEIVTLGIHDTEESQNDLYIYEQNGMKIAILNYTYGTNGIPLPDGMPYAVDLLEESGVTAAIDYAEEAADFTIVCPHWGTEYYLDADNYQKKWTDIFLQHGVDLVLGTHPHVIEPVEWVKDEESGNEMLVYYSLGNYANWTGESGSGIANRCVGGMAEVTLDRNEEGNVTIKEYGITPLVCHLPEGDGGVSVYFLSDYTEELGSKNAIIYQDSRFSYEYAMELCDQVWGDLWREGENDPE